MPYYQSSSSLESLLNILKKAVSEKIIPGGVLLIGKPSSGEFRIISEGNLGRTRNIIPVTKSTIYDLASLTKLISTLHLFLILLSEKHSSLKLENTLGELFEEVPTDLSQVTIRELLSHQSGLPPWRPLYLNRGDISYEGRKALVIRAILNERPLFPKGNSTLYSDLGFILLGFILEDNQNKSLSHLFDELITLPLKLESTLFSPKLQKTPYPFHNIAPTEDGFRRGGPLDYPGVPILGPVPPGHPHDDNAGYLSGTAGHAGLFSSVENLFKIVASFELARNSKHPTIKQDIIEECLSPQVAKDLSLRPLGFDMRKLPKAAIFGHLGYTGTSLWWSYELDRVLIVLCNRVHPSSLESRMPKLRESLIESAFPDLF